MQVEINLSNINKRQNIIDIRSLLEYSKKNINGSINVPKSQLMSNPEKYMNKKDTYFLICDKGKVSLICAKMLNALGYNCYSVKGGIEKNI